MIGYHFTPFKTYEIIKECGIIPYKLDYRFDQFLELGMPTHGIWIYKNKQGWLSEKGCVLWQQRSKNENKICLLEITYDKKDTEFGSLPYCVAIQHTLSKGNFIFHSAEEATIIFKKIFINDIQLINIWELPPQTEKTTLTITYNGT